MITPFERGVVSVENKPIPESLHRKPKLLIVGNTYQPPREFLKVSSSAGDRADILALVNEQVYEECYRQVFERPPFSDAQPLPWGTLFSIYGILREWWKGHHPDSFNKLRENIQKLEDKEYRILGDSYLHPILPLESEENQEMLIKIGEGAFFQDLGFMPLGFWLPETAVSAATLRVLFKNGYQFVVLRNNQLQSAEQNPMFIPIVEGGKTIGEIAVFHCDRNLSDIVSFDEKATVDAHIFLENGGKKDDLAWMTDTELYGHHLSFRDQFLYTVTNPKVLKERGFEAFDVRKALEETPRKYTHAWENTSWSCPDNLGRWTGDPNCKCNGTQRENEIEEKQNLRQTLNELGREIDERLEKIDPSWREKFVRFFLATRKPMYFQGDINKNIKELIEERGMDILTNPQVQLLFKANLARWTALTSCVWFFGGDRPEREIAQVNIGEIKNLLQDAS